ncbi:unnamed protein product [Ranitomeya imitator]|uniref:Glycoside hydrolase family 2 catalytic domain-containing protein n=1 Tax=Ranitomeya imitator TaxID=111125 RepID=A0ABN9KM95_9NEOB|nr:unnamed protein product [Ranitomeya imitator]
MWLWVYDDDAAANEALSWMDNSETVEQNDGDLEDNSTSQWAVVIEPVFDAVTRASFQGMYVLRIPQLQVDQSQDLQIDLVSEFISVDFLVWPNMVIGHFKQAFGPNYTIARSTISITGQFYIGLQTLIVFILSMQIYFRTVELVEEPVGGSPGLSFYMKINGVPIFLKGSNWIPADSFQDRVNSDRLRNLLQSAVDANMNTLRVWGGGIYETDEFYSICDDLGYNGNRFTCVLHIIWQDFMFACALYPTDDWFLDTVREEVTHQIRRLKSHPCIIVWSGNNENEAAIASDWFSIPSYMKEVYVKDYLTLYIKTIRELVLQKTSVGAGY